MSDKKEQSQQRDYFSQYIQQQLRGHEVSPDEFCWNEIGQRLRRRRNRLLLRRGLYITAAATVALLLLVSILWDESMPSQPSQIIEEIAISNVKQIKPIDNPVIEVSDVKPMHQSPVRTAPEESVPEETIEIISENIPETVKKTETENEGQEDAPIVNQKKKNTELPVLPDKQISLPHKASKKRNWQVSAGLLAMGNYTLGNGESMTHQDQIGNNDQSSGWIPSPPGYNNVLGPEDCDDISYNLPLSFGITARKELGRKFFVETGLVYTYLSTNFRQDNPYIKGKLALHYLGIPVNLIVKLWDNPKWDIYTSAGIMVEKGLRSVYRQETYRANRTEESTVKTSISGFQCSINGAFGISYRIQRDWSIYAEPRISYFFDNNQPISVRTDKPLTLGFGLGVRFDF